MVRNIGFGIPNDKIRCPICQTKFTNIPKTCAFNISEWIYDGVIMENGDTKKVKSEWKHVGDKYYHF